MANGATAADLLERTPSIKQVNNDDDLSDYRTTNCLANTNDRVTVERCLEWIENVFDRLNDREVLYTLLLFILPASIILSLSNIPYVQPSIPSPLLPRRSLFLMPITRIKRSHSTKNIAWNERGEWESRPQFGIRGEKKPIVEGWVRSHLTRGTTKKNEFDPYDWEGKREKEGKGVSYDRLIRDYAIRVLTDPTHPIQKVIRIPSRWDNNRRERRLIEGRERDDKEREKEEEKDKEGLDRWGDDDSDNEEGEEDYMKLAVLWEEVIEYADTAVNGIAESTNG